MVSADLIQPLVSLALATAMLAIGLSVTWEQVRASAKRVRLVVPAIATNFVVVPLATLALLAAFRASPMVAVGFLTLAVCPGAAVGPPAAATARADVESATAMMVVLTVLSAVLSPILLAFLLRWASPQTLLTIDAPAMIGSLFLMQLLPLGVGLAIHRRMPDLARRLHGPSVALSKVLFMLLLGAIIVVRFRTLAEIGLRAWGGMVLLLAVTLASGWLSGGRDRAERTALALTTASRNVAVGLVLVGRSFAGTPAVSVVVAFGLVLILGVFGLALLLRWLGNPRAVGCPAES